MPKAKTPKQNKPKTKREPYAGLDAKVVVNIFAPDCEPQEFTFTVPNIRGNASLPERTPVKIAGAVMGGLASKYGRGIKSG